MSIRPPRYNDVIMKLLTKPDRTTLRIEAYTDPAGKYDESAPLNGNEDNFFVSNHGDAEGLVVDPEYGILIAVADGMGGLNAGEVASGIAIETVEKAFTPEKLASMASHNGPTRQMFLERIIREADAQIKEAQRRNPAQANMGSTIILAWLMGNELVVSWCGDSRAYLYNASAGLCLISHDHSYVQELVDRGAITYEQAFDHPQNNIVTQSLGDPQHDARPESRRLIMGKGDILMVCSDGLSGVLRDKKSYDSKGNLLPEINMEDIFRSAPTLKECRVMLWDAAAKSGWYDNVTAVLCEMVDGPEADAITQPAGDQPGNDAAQLQGQASPGEENSRSLSTKAGKSRPWVWIIAVAVVVAIAFIAYRFVFQSSEDNGEGKDIRPPELMLNQTEDVNDNTTDKTGIQYDQPDGKDQKHNQRESKSGEKNGVRQQNQSDVSGAENVEPTSSQTEQQMDGAGAPENKDPKPGWIKKPAKSTPGGTPGKKPKENTEENN